MPHRRLAPPTRLPRKTSVPQCDPIPLVPIWPSYTGQSTYVGTSPSGRCNVFVDSDLGPLALQNAQDLVNDADRVTNFNDAVFGAAGQAVNVILFAIGGASDGTGGADHMACDFTFGGNIEVCVSFDRPDRVSALFEAELSECAMGGELCGMSTGEALSRWCAMKVSGNALSDFATAPTWQASGSPNFVDSVEPTDRDAIATGCGMAFLSWLSVFYDLPTIAQAMVSLGDQGTLAALYAALSSNNANQAWPNFGIALAALVGPIVNDDPFAGAGP